MKRITRDSLPHLVFCASKRLRIWLHTRFARFQAAWWGVRLGRGCSFNGLPILRRHPGSRILVGQRCSFNSASDAHQGGIARPCILWTLAPNANIEIGDGCGFSGTVISAECGIRLGRNVRCGTNTRIMDGDMHSGDPRAGTPQPVVIGDDVWLGTNTLVMKGVTIGEGTFVGSNSLVLKPLPGRVVAAGSPAKVIRSLDPAGASPPSSVQPQG